MTKIIVALDGITFNQAMETGILSALSKAREKGMIWGIKVNDMLYTGDVTKIISSQGSGRPGIKSGTTRSASPP